MTDFSLPPYFDDYDEAKGYYKILFRPSVAVQARELNQMQTMVQKQIERFGSHIFREGSLVVGGAFDLEMDIGYITASSVYPSISNIQDFVGQTVTGASTGVKAIVRAATYDTDNNVAVFMIRYLNATTASAINNGATFLDTEVIKVSDYLYFTASGATPTTTPPSSVGKGSIFSIGEGVLFSKGYFIAFPKQTIILTDPSQTSIALKYTQTPSVTIGLQLNESIVTDLVDSTLLDNAAGSYNENAPGAHRYAIDATLTAIAYRESYQNPNFAVLMNIKEGHIEESNERSEYARIYEELAKRTFDESGDYYVRGLGIRTREHLDTGSNEGLYTANAGGDSTKLSIDVEPGLGYVKGYEINKLTTSHVITDKSLDYNSVNNQRINARTGGYIYVNQVVGQPTLDQGSIVGLYSLAETRATNVSLTSTTSINASSVLMGSARVKSFIYETGDVEDGSAKFRLYLYDINMNAGNNFMQVNAVANIATSGGFFADVVKTSINGNIGQVANATNQSAYLLEKKNQDLLFYVGSDYTRSIRNGGVGGGVDTSFVFHRSDYPIYSSFGGGSTGILTLNVATSAIGETFDYSTGYLSHDERDTLVVTTADTIEIQLTNTVPNTIQAYVTSNTTNGLLGSNTTFTTQFNPSDKVKVNGGIYRISSIVNNTVMILANTISPQVTVANTFARYVTTGDYFDMGENGTNGLFRTAYVSGTTMTIDMKEDTTWMTPANPRFKVTYRVARNNAAEMKKLLNPNRYVLIRVASNAAGKSGPFNLGLPDVYKIKFVRLITSASTSSPFTDVNPETQGSDVTSSFTLFNGQTDNMYDHAKLYNSGNLDLTNAWLLVKLDHFVADFSTGLGYFSVDSYPIDDTQANDNTIFTYQIPKYKTASGLLYDLRNVLDFRPVKTSTATSSVLVSTATINPATSTTLSSDGFGLRTAVPDSTISADYTYYLGRIDVVTLDKYGNFGVVKGDASKNPVTPIAPDNVMSLAKVYIPPYPSISETLGRILNNRNIGCISKRLATIRYTMRDIGVMKGRIDTLEYYNALTLLEKSAKDLKVVNDQGLDRFKNGFFVDGFLDHSLGATTNSDYRIAVDKAEQCIRPFFEFDAFPFQYDSTTSSGVVVTNNLITLPYTETVLLENKNVTTYRNVEQSVFRFIGTITLSPETDNWVDTSTVDKTIKTGGDVQNSMSTDWGSWQTYATGYSVYDRNYGDRTGTVDPAKFEHGGFASFDEAKAWAEKNDSDGRYLIVENGQDVRKGIQTTVTSETQTQDLGSFVTDVSIIPYIRPQIIKVYARGLKANTLFHLYFDGEDMSSYATKMIRLTDYTGTTPWSGALVTYGGQFFVPGTENVTPLRSDATGELLCFLRLPATGKRFRTGTKEVIYTDSPTNDVDATSYAKAYFVSSGLSVHKQNTIISTQIPVITETPLTDSRNYQNVSVMGPSCMAYSFKVDVPLSEEGVFLTSVDVWFQAKHANLGVWFEIREMSNGGVTRNQVPYSKVWLTNSQVNLWDGTAATETAGKTNVKFDCPVFLMNNTEYAFVIHTEGLNPDYYMWVSRLGETDYITGKQVTGRQLTGTLYTTNNNLNYDMVPDVDLKVRFNRAQFTVGTGTAYFGNVPVDFPILGAGAGSFPTNGETVKGSQGLTLSTTANSTGGTIVAGDKITIAAKSITGNIISISPYYYTDIIGFDVNDSYTISNTVVGNKLVNGSITATIGGSGTLRKYDSNTSMMIIDNSNGLFFPGATITGMTSGSQGTISSFSYYPYSTTTLKPYYLMFKNTSVSFEKQGFVFGTGLGDWYAGVVDGTSDLGVEHRILSRVNEISNSVNYSSSFRANMTTTSEFVSPVVDTNRAQQIYVHNIINTLNPDVVTLSVTTAGSNSVVVGDKIFGGTSYACGTITSIVANVAITNINTYDGANGYVAGETYTIYDSGNIAKNITSTIYKVVQNEDLPKGGQLFNKYISKTVTLADGQDAEDLLVKLTVHKPENSDIQVWAKIKHAEDGSLFDDMPYIQLDYNKDFYTSTADKNNYVEIDYKFPDTMQGTDPSTGTANVVYYTTSSGTKFYGFKQYAIKVGLFGTDSANIPKVADLRAIALQK